MRFNTIATLAIFAIPFAAGAQVTFTNQNSPNSNQPLAMPAWELVTTGGDVTATIESFDFHGGPGYNNNQLFVGTSTSNQQLIGTNYQFGKSIDLGNFAAGTEIIVSMISQDGGHFYSGSASSLNSDSHNHVDLYNTAGGANAAFEDLSAGGSDWNYGDAKLSVSNTQAVPEPAPFLVLGAGLGVFLLRRRS